MRKTFEAMPASDLLQLFSFYQRGLDSCYDADFIGTSAAGKLIDRLENKAGEALDAIYAIAKTRMPRDSDERATQAAIVTAFVSRYLLHDEICERLPRELAEIPEPMQTARIT